MNPRSRSRSPLRHRNESYRASPTPSNVSASSTTSNISRKNAYRREGKFCIKLNSVPLSWKFQDVAKYIMQNEMDTALHKDISYIQLISGLPQHPNTQCSIVFFHTEEVRNQAFELLKHTKDMVDGRKLFVTKCNEDGTKLPNVKKIDGKFQKPNFLTKGSQMKFQHNQKQNPYNAPMPVNTETFGLSVDYLKELEISPPLTNKVFVRYVPICYNEEAKVRSLFSQAGTILSVVLLPKPVYVNVRIEYDHPVEAVQAVAMFNNQELFNKQIKCEMDRMHKVWTEGMPVQGPGLGPNGTPMRGVRVSVEVKKLKTELMSEFQKLSDTVEELKAQVMNLQANTPTKVMTNPLPSAPNPILNAVNPIAANQLATLGNLITKQLQPMQLLQSLVQSSAGNDLGLLGNALQTLTGSNLGNILQQALPNQGNSNLQGSPNMQPGNMQSAPNMLLGLNNMQGGPNNMQSGSNNMHGGLNNMQNELNNMQSGSNNMQGVINTMQSGSNNMQGGLNMQRGLNVQCSPANMKTGHNAQGGPNMQSGHFKMQSGSNEMAPSNMQSGLNNMQSGPQNMQHGNQDAFGSTNTYAQQGNSNMQAGQPYNMQSGFGGSNEQINMGYGGPQSNYNNNGRQEMAGNASAMLLFQNLPISVTLSALQAKMREVGNVKFVQITGPGRALVHFFSDHDADKCIRLFNQSKVDGQIIEVKKM